MQKNMSQLQEKRQNTYEDFELKVAECLQLFKALNKEEKLAAWKTWNGTTDHIKTLVIAEKAEPQGDECIKTNTCVKPGMNRRGRPPRTQSGSSDPNNKKGEKIKKKANSVSKSETDCSLMKKIENNSGHCQTTSVRRSSRQIKPSKIYPELAKMTFKREPEQLCLKPPVKKHKIVLVEPNPIKADRPNSFSDSSLKTYNKPVTLKWDIEAHLKKTEDLKRSLLSLDTSNVENINAHPRENESYITSDCVSNNDNPALSKEFAASSVEVISTKKNKPINSFDESIVAMSMKACDILVCCEEETEEKGGAIEDSCDEYQEPKDENKDTRNSGVESRFETSPEMELEPRHQGKNETVNSCRLSKRKKLKFTENKEASLGEESVTCRECGKTLVNKSNLVVHMRVHTGEKPYECSLCGRFFSTRPNMLRHEKTHIGLKPFKCSECGKCFTEKKSLKIHTRSHTGEKPYECEKCGKSFSQTGTLQSHMHTHTGWKGHLCQYCGKSFRQKSQLKTHVLRHDNIRNFFCDACDKSFISKGDLERHRMCHTGERPFLCTLCPKTFTRLQYLKEHINTHTGVKPYKCRFCGKLFPDVSTCNRHVKKHEKEEKPTVTSVKDTMTNETVYVVQYCPDTMLQTMQKIQSETGEALLVPEGGKTVTVDLPSDEGQKQVELRIPYVVLEENAASQEDSTTELPVSDVQGGIPSISESKTEIQYSTEPSVAEDENTFVEIQYNSPTEPGHIQEIILHTTGDQPIDLSDNSTLLRAILEARQQQGQPLSQNIVISHNPAIADTTHQIVSSEDLSKIDHLAANTEQEHLYSTTATGESGEVTI